MSRATCTPAPPSIALIKTCEAGLVLSVTRILEPHCPNSVCMYVCVTTPSKPLNRFAYNLYQQIERLMLISIGYLDLKYLPPPYL